MAEYTPFDSTVTTYTPSKLWVFGFPIEDGTGTIITGTGVVVAGTVVGKITASGLLTPCDKDAVDGSQIPVAITKATVDATSAAASVKIAKTGRAYSTGLTFAAGTVVADVIELMEARNLYPIEVSAA
ncbi:MAG: head decoration protein [Deltaproteobacteria bacterium]|nr:head decoration protein [Deltaproteobacteria bacterium]